MKKLVILVLAVMMASCEKHASEAEVNQARERIAELGGRVGQAIEDLDRSTEPGKIALATEDLREDRQKLQRAIDDVANIISREEAEKIANLHQGRARENIQRWRAESEAKSQTIRFERIKSLSENMEKLKAEHERQPFGSEFVLPED